MSKPDPKRSFFAELQRRNVYKVGAMYAVAGWLLVQVVTQVLPVFDVSALGQRILVLIVVAGFPVALVLSWLFDITPQGIVRTPDATAGESASEQRHGMDRKLNYVLGALLVLALGYFVLERTVLRGGSVAAAANGKSIAVLPFENLSDDKANAYFAEGVQDEILTRLAGVGALKVISRTSTEKYKSRPENLRAVADELGVNTILEGSVQKAGDRVRVNVQLIDARADAHLWANIYDRDLKDVFAVESEVSQSIVDALKARLSPSETVALAAVPTQNSQAYDLFLKGEYDLHRAIGAENDGTLYDSAAGYYRQAVALDPAFALADARMAQARLYRHWWVAPLGAAELEDVKSAIDRALALQPDLPEAHDALGLYHYWGFRDYDAALAEFRRALALKPSDAEAQFDVAAIHRRLGQWPQALAAFEQAMNLAPRDAEIVAELGATYTALRRYDEAKPALVHALAISPDSMLARRFLSQTIVNSSGDLEQARQVFAPVPANHLVSPRRFIGGVELDQRIYLDVLGRHFDQALDAWNKAPQATPREQVRRLLGLVTTRLLAGERPAAQADCAALNRLLQTAPLGQQDPLEMLMAQSWVGLCLDRNEDAIRAAREAVERLPVSKDAVYGPYYLSSLAQVEALAGRPDEAIPIVEQLLAMPAGSVLSVQRLRIDPVWDSLRQDPRFQKLLGNGAP